MTGNEGMFWHVVIVDSHVHFSDYWLCYPYNLEICFVQGLLTAHISQFSARTVKFNLQTRCTGVVLCVSDTSIVDSLRHEIKSL